MNLIFRKLDPENERDVSQFNELMDDLTTHAHDTEKLRGCIRRMNAREDAYLTVAEDPESGRLCASALVVTFDDFCDDCRPLMIVENVVVHHDFRRRGIGGRVFEEIEAWGRACDVNYVVLCSAMHRVEAHQFYDAIGYQPVKGFKKYL